MSNQAWLPSCRSMSVVLLANYAVIAHSVYSHHRTRSLRTDRVAAPPKVAGGAPTEAGVASGAGQAPKGPAEKPLAAGAPGDDRPFPVDAVYCWSGEESQGNGMVQGSNHSGKGFNEIWWSLRSVEKHMPWLNKIYILTNTGTQASFINYESGVVEMVNRCELFPRKEDCPTKSSAACCSVSHRVPNLSEHWLIFEDDFNILWPLKKSDFFDESGTPLVVTPVSDYKVPIYGKPKEELTGPDVDKIPDKMPTRTKEYEHIPIGVTTTFAFALEKEYADFYAWVRSHRERYTCCDATGRETCGANFEEELGWIYTAQMLEKKYAHYQPRGTGHYCGCSGFRECLRKTLGDKYPFVVQNNCATWQDAAAGFLALRCLNGDTDGRLLLNGTHPFPHYTEPDYETWCKDLRAVRDVPGEPWPKE